MCWDHATKSAGVFLPDINGCRQTALVTGLKTRADLVSYITPDQDRREAFCCKACQPSFFELYIIYNSS